METKTENSQAESIKDSASIYGSFSALEATQHLKEATKRVFHDSEEMRRVLEQYQKCAVSFNQGRALEFLEVLKFNRDAAENNRLDLFAYPRHFEDPHSNADIVITKDGQNVFEAQVKSIGDTATAIREHAKEKYYEMGRLNPSDQYESIKALLEKRLQNAPDDQIYKESYLDVKKNLIRHLNYEGVSSGGTNSWETNFAAENPELVQLFHNGQSILNEISQSTLYGSTSAAGFAAITKGILSSSQVIRGEKELASAVSETMALTASAAIRGGIVAGTSKAIGIAARSEGLKSFAEGAGPIAIANTLYNIGKSINSFKKGKIDKETLKEECGEATIRGMATYYCGIAGQILIPVPILGALVGSLVGYTSSAILVQAGILGVGKKNIVFIAKRRRAYIEEQTLKAIELMGMYRSIFEYIGSVYAKQYTEKILPTLSIIDYAIIKGDAEIAIQSLAHLNDNFSKKIQFRTFDEFERFMIDKNTVLVL